MQFESGSSGISGVGGERLFQFALASPSSPGMYNVTLVVSNVTSVRVCRYSLAKERSGLLETQRF
jgi:hypothetical protein